MGKKAFKLTKAKAKSFTKYIPAIVLSTVFAVETFVALYSIVYSIVMQAMGK